MPTDRVRIAVPAALALVILLVASPVVAQTTGLGGAVIRHAEPGQPTIAVNLWGDIGGTGLWIIQPDVDLLRLLTLAGGPAMPTDAPRRRISVTVSISREQGGVHRPFFTTPVADITDGRVNPPRLQNGDIVVVETHVREVLGWRDVMSIVSTVGTLALVVWRVTDRL